MAGLMFQNDKYVIIEDGTFINSVKPFIVDNCILLLKNCNIEFGDNKPIKTHLDFCFFTLLVELSRMPWSGQIMLELN